MQENMKRGIGCATLNRTTYSTGGVTFDILCNQYWGHEETLFVNYTPTFPSCINGCASWNSINSGQCLGVDWTYGVTGPNGTPGGSLCRYLWSMNGSGDPQDGEDSARLQPQFIPFPSTTPTITTTLPAPQPTNTQCQNGSTYSSTTGQAQFELFCGMNWWSDTLYLNHTLDFQGCMNGCAMWNTNSTVPCVGVSYIGGIFGPKGDAGGSQCFYKWRMIGLGSGDVLSDSARLQSTDGSGTIVSPAKKWAIAAIVFATVIVLIGVSLLARSFVRRRWQRAPRTQQVTASGNLRGLEGGHSLRDSETTDVKASGKLGTEILTTTQVEQGTKERTNH